MNYDEQMQQVIESAKSDVEGIASDARSRLIEMNERHNEKVLSMLQEFRSNADQSMKEAISAMEKTKKNILTAAAGVFALILLGFIMFLYYEAKDIHRVIIDLHGQIQNSREFMDREVEKFQLKTAEFNSQIDSVMEENQALMTSLARTSNQYESRLVEMNAATINLNTRLQEFESIVPVIEDWQEAWMEGGSGQGLRQE
ncbi:hypothetical protein [Billgrantia desiderata]|uniref:hypothetical protein n=1 Tax=Billgrantia desiderata TaxID=52021 RepID=UPI00089E4E08|nr:hypothetical protein [Halomonas desiderata]SEG44135.1 hypothetical protein SAMN04487953_13327 [Halomonas desiderata]